MATITAERLRDKHALAVTLARVRVIRRVLEPSYGKGKVTVSAQYRGAGTGQIIITIETPHIIDGLFHQVDDRVRRVVRDLPGRLTLYSYTTARRSVIDDSHQLRKRPIITRPTK